jgi:hypothetical protein
LSFNLKKLEVKKVKKIVLVIFLSILSVGLLFNLSSGQTCNPAESIATCCNAGGLFDGYAVDLGICDTLFVRPLPTTDTCIIYAYHFPDNPELDHTDTICINNPGQNFPCFMYVNLLVTHDSNSFFWAAYPPSGKWTRDSIASMTIPLGWTRTNPAKYCSLTTYWNENTVQLELDPDKYPRRIWRNFPQLGGDSTNLMDKLKWGTMEVGVSSDTDTLYTPDSVYITPPHAFINLIAWTKKKWRQEKDTLLATLTFRIEDTMHVYIDSTLCPPSSNLAFARYDGVNYVPRTNLPLSIWVGPPRIEVLSPNGGDTLCVGNTKDITWLSEKFTDPVRIAYSTNGGQSWIVIVASTPNTGVYHWPNVPNTPSTNCRVKVSDAADGVPSDSSDAPFTISAESITVTYPIGGEVFVAGDSLSITWNSTCFTGSVNILMSEDGGTHWNPIVSGTENDGIHPTLISQSVSTNKSLIKVSDSVDGIPSDQSDGFFTVRNFSISAKPETLVVSAGEDTSCKVILESQFGFNLPCTLTVSEDSLPLNTTYDLDTRTVVPTDTAILTFHTQLSTPAGTSRIIVSGTKISGTKNQLEHSTKVVLIVTSPPPDFSIDASPETLKVTRGDSTGYTVDLDSIYGFGSPCTLSVAGLPPAAKEIFAPSIVTPPGNSILAINTYADSIAVGEYKPIITGRNGGLIHSDTVTFIVESCTSTTHFTFTETDSNYTVMIDSAFLYQVRLEECDEIAVFDSDLCVGACVYHHSDKASLTLLAWKDNPITSDTDGYIVGDSMYFKIWSKEKDKEEDALAHYSQGDGTFGSPGDTAFVWLEAPPSDFSIDIAPDTLKVPRGYSGNYKVILMSINGFSSNCTLTVVGNPGGSTATFNPPAIVPRDSSILTIAIPDTLTVEPCPCVAGEPCPPCTSNIYTGIYTLAITAAEMKKDKGITHSKDVILKVTLPTWDFKVEAFPDTQRVEQGDSTTYGVLILPNVAFKAPCTLFVEGLPNGATADFDTNIIPPTGKDTSTLTINTLLSTPDGEYDLAIIAVANKKQKHTTYVKLIVEQKTGVNREGDQLVPSEYALFQNYPNPFNASTTIEFAIPDPVNVKLEIFNILGQKVKTLIDDDLQAGKYTLHWSADKDFPSGPYFYRLRAGKVVKMEKLILLK